MSFEEGCYAQVCTADSFTYLINYSPGCTDHKAIQQIICLRGVVSEPLPPPPPPHTQCSPLATTKPTNSKLLVLLMTFNDSMS